MANKLSISLVGLLIVLVQLSSQTSIRSLSYQYTAILEFNASKTTDYNPKQQELECKESAANEKLCQFQPDNIRCKNQNFRKLDIPKWLCEAKNISENVQLNDYNVTCADGKHLKGNCYLIFSLKLSNASEKTNDHKLKRIDSHDPSSPVAVLFVFLLIAIFIGVFIVAFLRSIASSFFFGGPTVHSSAPRVRRRPMIFTTFTSSRPHTSSSTGFASTSFRSGGGFGGGSGVSSGFASTSFR